MSIAWCDQPGEIEARDGVLILNLCSGGETFTFAMSMRTMGVHQVRCTKAMSALAEARAQVIPFAGKGGIS